MLGADYLESLLVDKFIWQYILYTYGPGKNEWL